MVILWLKKKKAILVTHNQFIRDFQRNKWFLKTNTQKKQNEHIPMEFEFLSIDHKNKKNLLRLKIVHKLTS